MKVIYFWATFCGPCKVVSPVVDAINAGGSFHVDKINIEEDPEVANDFGIRSVPALLMVDDDGNEVKRLIGLQSKEKISEFIGV